MKRRVAVAAIAANAGHAGAAGLGATGIAVLDGIKIDEGTKAVTLLLVIDRPLEDGLTKPKVRGKLLAYHEWVYVDRKLAKYYPEANTSAAIGLLILHPEPKSALGGSVLEQIVGYAKELQFQPTAKLLPVKG